MARMVVARYHSAQAAREAEQTFSRVFSEGGVPEEMPEIAVASGTRLVDVIAANNLTSSKGAMGLMQLMPETANELGVKNSYNPFENIMAGTRYLKSLLHRYDGNIPLALAAYNWGMGNVERNPGRLPSETRTYIARVNKYYREVKS